MALPQKPFAQLVSDMVTAWSNEIGVTPTLSEGDLLLAIFQSVATQLDFLQRQAEIANDVARDQTSQSANLDTFFAQFGFERLGAQQAEGVVTFSKLQPATAQILIAAGTIVQTTGGAIQYSVIADTTQPTWSPSYNAYVLASGQSSLAASVQALAAGSVYNVAATALNQFASSVPGIDSVSNAEPISNGTDAQSDAAARVSFVNYLQGLSKATLAAILAAANSVEQNLQIAVLENQTPNGVSQLGSFSVMVDNGTGNPPSSLLTAIYNAVYAVRALSVQPYVSAPSVITANISLSVRIASGYTSEAVLPVVKNAIATMVNQLNIGSELYVSSVEAAALAVAGVVAVEPDTTTINSSKNDLAIQDYQAARTNVSDINVGTY